MKTRTLQRALSMLLTAAMVFNTGLTPVFAAEGVTPPGVSGVCTHHTEHTEDCGYTPDSPCTFDPESCTECNTGDKPAEKVCTCPPVDSGELVHGKNCPLYIAPPLSEAVTALVAMVDTLPNAADITEKNRETVKPDFEAAAEAYGALSEDDKAAFEATEQHKKLMALQAVLYPSVLMANETAWNISTGDLTLTDACGGACAGHTVTGETTTYKIIVSSGTHNVTLDGVTIDVNGTESACAFEIKGGATVNLTLTGTNVLKSGMYRAGLEVIAGNTLIITSASTGSLDATGGYNGAGIGGCWNGAGGTITISGGTVTATGGENGAGIGGGASGAGGTITISGGTVTATAPASGFFGAGGSITISGHAVVFATKGTNAPNHIGVGSNGDAGTVTRSGGIIFEGEIGTVYGNITLGQALTIAPEKTLTINSGNVLEVGSGVTFTNNGIINNLGTITNKGTLSGNGSLTGGGVVQTALTGSVISLDQDSYVYTGSAFEPTVTVAIPWTGAAPFVKNTDFTVEYTANTVAGTATVTVTPKGSNLTGSTVSKTFTITQSDTAFTGGIKTYKDTNEQSTFTYGDTITVKVTVAATGTAPAPTSRAVPTANQMALFKGNVQLTDPQTVISGTELTFTIATTDKQLAIGENAITAKYGGSNNLNGVTQTVNVTLNQKPLTATVNTSHANATKVYDGNDNFTGVALILTGLEAEDSGITATASGTAMNANVDTSKMFIATSVTLSGTSNDCYTLDENAITGNVSITAATPTVSMTAVKKVSRLRTAIGDHNDTIVLTATSGGVNGEKPDGSVVFKNGNDTIATVNTTNGVATYDWANPPAGSITVTAEFTASDTETNYTKIAVKGTADAFDIDKGAQSALTVNVPVLTYGDTGKSLTTSGGSTNGTVTYTVTGGDCVTVGADGAITVVKAGTVKVTATMQGNSDYNDVTSAEATITVAPATPTISWGANTTQTVTYTGAAAAITPPTVTLVNGEIYSGTITYQHKSTATKLTNLFGLLEGYTAGLPTNAGEYKIVATVAADGNYAAADSGEMTLTISKITSTLDINAMAGKTYDGTAIADPTNITSNITNPTVTYTYYKDNGSGAKGDRLSSAPKDAGNYWVEGSIAETGNTTAVTSTAVIFTIAQAPLTITGGTVTPREYDSTTAATVTALTFSGLQNGETLAITTDYTVGTPTYDSADAGTNKTVSGTAALVSNDKTSNYTLTGTYSIANQTIAKKTGIAAPTYAAMDDSTTTKSFTFGTVSGYDTVTDYEWKLEGDTAWASVTVNPITFGNRAGKMQVRVKATTNYEAGAILTHDTAFTATLEGSVSIDGTAAYGETLTATPTGTQTGAVLSYEWKSGTTVLQTKSISNTYKIAGTAVGDTITVEVTAEGYTGSLTAFTTAVAKRNLTVTATAQNKEYDGNTNATVSFTFGLGEVISGDDVTVAATGAFTDKNVGDGKTVNIPDFALGGVSKDYYTVTTPPTTAIANITAKVLTVGDGTLAITKEYDTTTAFTAGTGSLGLTGVVGGETVGVKIDSYGAAADANVGTKTLLLGISLGGADKGNYTVTSPYSFTKASISAKVITPTIEPISPVTYTGSQIKPAVTVKVGGSTIADSNYTVEYGANVNAGTGSVTVKAKTTGNYTFGDVTASFTINRATGPAISGYVTGSYTGNGTTFTYTIVSISGAEYKTDSGAWQDSNVFAGIAPMSKHTFSDRMKADANHLAGAEKAGGEVEFVKLSGVGAPTLAYTVSGQSGSRKITITAVDGAEYQFGDTWGDTREKVYFTDDSVSIGIRMKATATHEMGAAATASVNLAKQEQTTPATFTLTYTANGETNYTVAIPEVAGCEYSFDGATYSSTRTKTANVGDTITGYMRKAETTTHNASPAVSAGVTLPMFKVQPVTANPNGGSFTGSTTVSLTSDTADAEIYYTTNGSTPSTASTKYTATFTLTDTTTVKAIAVKTGMTDSNVASFTFSKNSGGGSGSGGGGSTPTPPVTPEIPMTPTTAETGVNSKTDRDGNATATVADKDITNAIDKAQKEAKKNGTEANGIAITLNVKTKDDTKSLAVTLSSGAVTALTNAKVAQLTINSGLSTITLDGHVILKLVSGGDVILTASKVDVKTLSAEAQNAIGNRPVFQFSLTSDGKTVSDFKGGRVGLQIPYTLTTTEQAGNLCAVYVDGNGKLTWLENSSYDPISGMMLASTSHFSIYGVGYKQSTPKFTDVGTHWAKNDIDFVVARGLLNGINAGGTSNTTFAPDQSMTRGMFVTALGRLAGVDTKKYQSTKFTDVAATAYYSPYVAWASANNIVTGTSDTTFSPDKAISRQEMAVMLVNYSKTIGYDLPSVHAQVTFTDASSIASWAKDAVGQMQMAGILMGKSGNRFDPTATATRAEVSAMLRRYVELVVSTETAEGWAMNESGQWMYIQDGKRITGKKNIDGTAYTFDQYGVTTALPQERKYLTYTVQTGDSFWSIAQKYKVSMLELARVNGRTIFSVIYTGDELKIPQK